VTLVEGEACQSEGKGWAELPLEHSCQSLTGCCQFQLAALTPPLATGEPLAAAKVFPARTAKNFLIPRKRPLPDLRRPVGRLPCARKFSI